MINIGIDVKFKNNHVFEEYDTDVKTFIYALSGQF